MTSLASGVVENWANVSFNCIVWVFIVASWAFQIIITWPWHYFMFQKNCCGIFFLVEIVHFKSDTNNLTLGKKEFFGGQSTGAGEFLFTFITIET